MRLSQQLFADRFDIPTDWHDMPSYRLFERFGLVHFASAGFPLFLPTGKRVMDRICGVIRRCSQRNGFDEIYLPLVQPRSYLESTGRADAYADEIWELADRDARLVLAPTNEEFFCALADAGLVSYRQLPARYFQIADKFRKVMKPKGILRSRQFLMCDMVSIDADEAALFASAHQFERVVGDVFAELGMKPARAAKNRDRYVDFLVECPEGETTVRIDDRTARYVDRGSEGATQASSVAMYFLFDQAEFLNVSYQGPSGHRDRIYLGTYGFGIQRCFHAAVECYRDDLGLALPASIRPFDVNVIVLDPDRPGRQRELGERLYASLEADGVRVLYDDRTRRNLKAKARTAEFYGAPVTLVVGRREAEAGQVTLLRRGQLGRERIAADAVAAATAHVPA